LRRKYRKRTAEEITFEREVQRAVAGLPHWVQQRLANVAIVIEDEPTHEQGEGPEEESLYAYFQGAPLGLDAGPFSLPGRIALFRRPLVGDFGLGITLRRELRRTIIHEVGHYFGMSEEEIARLGYE
jgi:predicted Zn-dependent protease with MMP-like domain